MDHFNIGIVGFDDEHADLMENLAWIDVWTDHFRAYTFHAMRSQLEEFFDSKPKLDCFSIVFHFMNGKNIGSINVGFNRDWTMRVWLAFSGGIPYTTDRARTIAEAAFIRIGASVHEIYYDNDDEECSWDLSLRLNDSSATIDGFMECWKAARSGLCTYRGDTGPDRAFTVIYKLTEGRFDEVIGEIESSSSEFKSNLRLNEIRHKDMLAKSVVAFANGDRSAALVVGFRTEKVGLGNHDTVVEMTPVPGADHFPERYRQIIDSYVHPPIRGLGINTIAAGDDSVIVIITVPAQREGDKPFACRRTIGSGTEKRVVDKYFLRREEGTIELTEADIKARYRAEQPD